MNRQLAVLVVILMMSVCGAFAAADVYNELGKDTGVSNDFWDTRSRAPTAVDSSWACSSFDLDTATEGVSVTEPYEIYTGRYGVVIIIR